MIKTHFTIRVLFAVLLVQFMVLAVQAQRQPSEAGQSQHPSGAVRSQQPSGSVQSRIDSIENKVLTILGHHVKNDSSATMVGEDVSEALGQSRKIGYSHGIAAALACQSVMSMNTNDFPQSEQLARTSLQWYDKTSDKHGIALAYYALGFSLFAQSRFDEAIRYLGLAREEARRLGNHKDEIYMLTLTGEAYRERGDYEKSFDTLQKSIQMAVASNNPRLVQEQYLMLAGLFVQIEDYSSAENYYRLGFTGSKPELIDPWGLMEYTGLLVRQHKFDSALYYFNRIDSAKLNGSILRTYLASKGEYYLYKEDYVAALPYLFKNLACQRRLSDRNQLMRCLQDLSRAYGGLGQDAEAFRYAREGLALAGEVDARQNIRDGYQMLWTLYDRASRPDSAYFYYRRYIAMKDSILNDELKGKVASYSYKQQIEWLNKEKQLQDVCIREQMLTKKLLIGGIIALVLFSFIITRYVMVKRKNEAHLRKRAEDELEIQRLEAKSAQSALTQKAKELEVQALRSQMNPHFIFNCLNAINRFILSHETEAASDYLTRFSRLMRMIMNHSRHSLISLDEELEVLQLYLGMEQLRFKNAFDYTIHIAPDIDASDIQVPPLLLQPFVENAVWHGLMQKQEHGLLTVDISVDRDMLICIIRDNGIGRQKAGLLRSKSAQKHKSMGLQITAERLALMTEGSHPGHSFRVDDLYDDQGGAAGTQVVLKIRINSPAGETESNYI